MQRGLEQGVKDKALETARKMLAEGYDLAEIAELTGLAPTDLDALETGIGK